MHNKGASAKQLAKIRKLTEGLNKILLDREEGIVDLSKFNQKGVYKHWRLVKAEAHNKPTAHRDSYWKLYNDHD